MSVDLIYFQIYIFSHVLSDDYASHWWVHDIVRAQQDEYRSDTHYTRFELGRN